MEFSVPMALVDFIPVILFLITAVMLQRDLYYHMGKGVFAVFSTGTIMVVTAGTLKATWKLLYALGICDFHPLSACFFPLQAIGFMLAGVAMIAMMISKGGAVEAENRMKASVAVTLAAVLGALVVRGEMMTTTAAPVEYSGTMIFVVMMCLGIAALQGILAYIGIKMKKWYIPVLCILAFVMMLGMGYLSSKNFEKASLNWIAEGVNVVGQGLFLLAVVLMHKAGLSTFPIKKAK